MHEGADRRSALGLQGHAGRRRGGDGRARHRAARAHRRPRCTSRTSAPPARSTWCASAKRARPARSPPRSTPHHFTLTDEAVGELRHQRQDEPAAAHRAPTSRRCVDGLRDGTIDAIATDHAPHHRDEKDVEFEQRRARHRRPRDGAAAGAARWCASTACSPSTRWSRALSTNPARILGVPGGTPRRGRRRRRDGRSIPTRAGRVEPDALPLASRATRRSAAGR